MATPAREFELGELAVHVWVLPLEHPDKGRRRELAHLAERQLLAAYLRVDEHALQFQRGAYGKPHLAQEPLRFNLSHSGAWAVLAVSRDLEVGIDIQGPHPATAKPWFAERICTAREREALGGSPGPAELLRLWVRKEAVIKARGDLSYVSAGRLDVLDDVVEGGWRCMDLGVPQAPNYQAAVAIEDRPGLAIMVRGRWPGPR
jgi:4'-phosphopantetheinyl transferase